MKNIDKIFNIIKDSKEHLTAEEIFLLMKEKEEKVVLATIYNNLATLLNNGQIMKISASGFPDRYDVNTKHDHLFCTVCGKLSDIHLKDLTKSLKKQINIDIDSYDLKVNYICDECKKKSQNNF